MPTDPLQHVLEAAQQSGLVSAGDRDKITREWSGNKPSTVQDVAARLVEKNVITAFQADQLLAGQGVKCGLAGRYHLLDKLGEGGMGAVYRARDDKLDRVVALKVMAARHVNNPDAVARFHREAKALAKVSHPAIVQAYDTGADGDRHFLVMEYVEGTNLARVLHERGRLPATQAADYIYQAALGLQQAHERGLVHRDMKPGNLLVTSRVGIAHGGPGGQCPPYAGGGQIKILDLGLARFVQDQIGDGTLTHEGMGLGTPDYMAPEQFRDARHVDPRADIYALGCTLYHLLTGRVPFPGSSLSEKAEAHEAKEPPAIEELCPDTPTGLALTVRRMMAKQPSARFATGQEVAEALAPHVAGSSASFPDIRATTSWQGSQLSFTLARAPARRRRQRWAVAGGLAAIVGLLLLAGLQFGWPWDAPEGSEPLARNGQGKQPEEKPKEAKKPEENPKEAKKLPKDPHVLTVSQDPREGGKFRSIKEALDQIKPGMTIRVLDQAIYKETLILNRAPFQKDITLEALQGATLLFPKSNLKVGLWIKNVPGVTIRGFRLRHEPGPDLLFMVAALGRGSGGTRLEGLEFKMEGNTVGVSLEGLNPTPAGEPTVVENCTFRGGRVALRASGFAEYHNPDPCGRIILRGNTILDAQVGISLAGTIKQVNVVGNRIAFSDAAGLQFENLLTGTEDILLANNTVLESGALTFCLWDHAQKKDLGKNIRLVNNLLLARAAPDMKFIDSGGNPDKIVGQGDGASLVKAWHWQGNWREANKAKTGEMRGWIPPGATDVVQDKVDLLSREPAHADFMRPPKDSPLATAGAGGDLPAYVGAVPPDGAPLWNWQWTWDAMIDKRLTVSKKPADSGRFRTIQEALAVVQPEMTIRVLGSDTYPGPLEINEPERMQGLTLEAERDAVIELPPDTKAALQIRGVPRVTVRGFRFTGKDSSEGLIAFLFARSACPGLRLERLKIQSPKVVSGVVILNADLKDADPAIVVRDCSIQTAGDGIYLSGLASGPTRRVLLSNNRIHGPQRGISLNRCLQHVLVAGNQIWDCTQAGMQFEDLAKECQTINVVNNSIADCRAAVRVWHNPPFLPFEKDQVLLANNLLLAAESGDMLYFRSENDLKFEKKSGKTAESAFLLDLWTFKRNARDLVGTEQKTMLPLAKEDRKITQNDLESRQAGAANFLRPKATSLLASGGAGKDDPSLPAYIGAVPPPGVAAWDWDRTWKAWFNKKQKSPEPEK